MDSKSGPQGQTTTSTTSQAAAKLQMPSVECSTTTGETTITVSDKDTLTSLAAKYKSTPNELIRLNRLNSRFIFPGQKLKIPDGSGQSTGQTTHAQLLLQRSNSNSVFDDQLSSDQSEPAAETIRQKKFIKLKVKHITDGNGVVSGTLLITPNAIMFDPNVSDPLVLDQGAEIYGIILPIELVVAAGLFNDISNMRVKQSFIEPLPSANVLLYKPPAGGRSRSKVKSSDSASPTHHPHAPQLTSHSMTSSQLQLSLSPLPLGKEEKSNILKRFSFPLTTSATELGSDSENTEPLGRGTTLSLDAEGGEEVTPPGTAASKTEDDLEEEDDPYKEVEQWYLCLTTGYSTTISTIRTSISPISYGQKKYLKPEYWFSIPPEDVEELYCFWNIWWPHLYGLVDSNLISSRGFALIDWTTDLSTVLNLRSPGHRRTPAPSTGGEDGFEAKVAAQAQQLNEITKESWEMIKAPYGKLYSFLQRGQTILTSTTSCDSNYGSTSSAASGSGGLAVPNPEAEFEIVSMSELDGRSGEYLDFVPELIGGPSLVFQEGHVAKICKHLTARAEGYPWWLVFSTETNGFSLGTLYRRMEVVDEWSPILLVVQDTKSRIFGALISTPLKLSEHFYGTGQSFLFNFETVPAPGPDIVQEAAVDSDKENKGEDNVEVEDEAVPVPETTKEPPEPQLNVYKWTGENLFFIKGNAESISIGAGDGKFGIWLDSDLFVGRTDSCWTYGNPALVPEKDFIVKTLEAWAFGASSWTSGVSASSAGTNPNAPSQAAT